jgi:hypothetical protein
VSDEQVDVIAMTENFSVYVTAEEGEVEYHLELGSVTVHLFREDWDELVALVETARDELQRR